MTRSMLYRLRIRQKLFQFYRSDMISHIRRKIYKLEHTKTEGNKIASQGEIKYSINVTLSQLAQEMAQPKHYKNFWTLHKKKKNSETVLTTIQKGTLALLIFKYIFCVCLKSMVTLQLINLGLKYRRRRQGSDDECEKRCRC